MMNTLVKTSACQITGTPILSKMKMTIQKWLPNGSVDAKKEAKKGMKKIIVSSMRNFSAHGRTEQAISVPLSKQRVKQTSPLRPCLMAKTYMWMLS